MVLFAQLLDDVTRRVVVTVLVAAVTSTATFFAGRWWGRYKASRQWHAKEFLDRIIISLNIFADGFLKIRTVMERSVQEVFLNRLAVDKVEAAARTTTVGLVAGLALAWFGMPLIQAQLFGVEPGDPATIGGVVVLFLLVAVASAFVPARRAAAADPAHVLRGA